MLDSNVLAGNVKELVLGCSENRIPDQETLLYSQLDSFSVRIVN